MTVFPAFHIVCSGVQFVLISQITFKTATRDLVKGVCGSSSIIRELSALENNQVVVILCVYGRRDLTSFCYFSPFGSVGLNNVMLHLFGSVLFWLDVFVYCILFTVHLRIVLVYL
jgi:hypothetical protein